MIGAVESPDKACVSHQSPRQHINDDIRISNVFSLYYSFSSHSINFLVSSHLIADTGKVWVIPVGIHSLQLVEGASNADRNPSLKVSWFLLLASHLIIFTGIAE